MMSIAEKANEPGKPDEADEGGAGEDDSSTEKNGDDSHLHDDQKSRTLDT